MRAVNALRLITEQDIPVNNQQGTNENMTHRQGNQSEHDT